MSLLVDTDVLIAVLRGRSEQSTKLRSSLATDSVYVSPVSLAELFAGMRASERQPTESLVGMLLDAPADATIGRIAGRYMAVYRPSHSTTLPDAVIAATAVHLRMPLWTLNKKHFPMPELRLVE